VGADVVAGMETWERADELRKLVRVAVVDRPGYSPQTLEGWLLLRLVLEVQDSSSSELRNQVGEGLAIDYVVPESVRRYIDRNQLTWQPHNK